jgi:hypothetical protein
LRSYQIADLMLVRYGYMHSSTPFPQAECRRGASTCQPKSATIFCSHSFIVSCKDAANWEGFPFQAPYSLAQRNFPDSTVGCARFATLFALLALGELSDPSVCPSLMVRFFDQIKCAFLSMSLHPKQIRERVGSAKCRSVARLSHGSN